MSIKKVEAHIDAIERKLTKGIKIAEKGPNMKLGDVAKLGRKTNSIVSEINKSIKEYDVSFLSPFSRFLPDGAVEPLWFELPPTPSSLNLGRTWGFPVSRKEAAELGS